jgi:3-hydroxybutyryl-CoA dehydrogenase
MNTNEIPIGVVGLGLMGCSICTCLLIAGHPVIALAPVSSDLSHAELRITAHLKNSKLNGLVKEDPDYYLRQLTITEDYLQLGPCQLVIECTLEDIEIKGSVFGKIETAISSEALLTSNTSAIPISVLQKLTKHPERFLGLHWAEPSHTTRFLEIICGDLSKMEYAEYLYLLSHSWGKEPVLVRKDIPGFIANRLMYAMYREAMYLVENGYASIEDIDTSCRTNAGFFMTYIGIFRWMDLTGVKAYHTVMKDLFPTLNNDTKVPKLIDDIVKAGGNGLSNGKGFYEYSPEEVKKWKETFSAFTYDIRDLAMKYPGDLVKNNMEILKNSDL